MVIIIEMLRSTNHYLTTSYTLTILTAQSGATNSNHETGNFTEIVSLLLKADINSSSAQTRCVWGGLTLTLHQLELLLAASVMPSLESIVSNATLFWFFATVALCVIFFTCYYVPETKNRDLASVKQDGFLDPSGAQKVTMSVHLSITVISC